MRESANKRPDRGRMPRRWRETHSYRKWRRDVLALYNDSCAITGKKSNSLEFDLVVHHLYGAKDFPSLQYVVENGIVLERNLHNLFHKNTHIGIIHLNNFKNLFFHFFKTSKLNIPSQSAAKRVRENSKVQRLKYTIQNGL